MPTAVPYTNEWSLKQTVEGYVASEVYVVTDLAGDVRQRNYDALQTSGIPRIAERHPFVPGAVCNDVTAKCLETGDVRVDVTYGRLFTATSEPSETAPTVLRVGARLQSATRNRDIDGQPILAYAKPDADGNERDPQNVEVEVQIPQVVFMHSRREPESPGDKARNFVGYVNATPVFGDPPRQWLCTAIEGSSIDGGESYDVVYEFEKSPWPTGWDVEVAYTNSETGRIHEDTLYTRYKIYGARNFLELGI